MRNSGHIRREAGSRVDRPDISASEIADYAFCARSWWLRRVRGLVPDSEQLHLGTAAHAAVGQRIATAVQADRMVKGLMWVLVALAVALLVALAG